MNTMAYNLSSFGSRFSLIFDPHNKKVKHGTLGMFLEHTSDLICGVVSDESESFIPYSGKTNNFQMVYMSTKQNSLTYTAINKMQGYNMEVTFTSPFAPGDEKMMCAPFFYVDVKITKSGRPHNLVKVMNNMSKGTFVFGVQDEALNLVKNGNNVEIGYDIQTQSRFIVGDFARTLKIQIEDEKGETLETVSCKEVLSSDSAVAKDDGLFYADFDLSEKDEWNFSYVWATHYNSNFIRVDDVPYKFLYENYFDSANAVTDFAWAEKCSIMKKSKFYEDMFENSSLSRSWKDFIAFTFQSYKLNTLWAINEAGGKSFSVWEGNCMFNSTMDVEYNNGLFYYTVCPQVLPQMFAGWAKTECDEGFIDHDLGSCYNLHRATYSHPMKIEENCNYTLMLHAYCKINGDYTVAKENYEVLKKIMQYNIVADTTGNGIPNEGTANTIDDAIPAIQFAKEQTYLALKSAATFQVFAEIAELVGDTDFAKTCKAQSEKITSTVDNELWVDDHYGVCLDKSQEGYKAFMTREELHGDMEGRDEASIYAENGILYPMMAGFDLKDVDLARMSENIINAYERCKTVYGSNHSENSDSVWISQNLWRDFSAAYLGHDILDNVDQYWQFQKVMNTEGRLNLFIDTYGENALWYYPRGLTSIGVLYAMLRLQINSITKTIKINPLRNTARIPLTIFADYNECKVPVVIVEKGQVSIENAEMLKDYKIIIG